MANRRKPASSATPTRAPDVCAKGCAARVSLVTFIFKMPCVSYRYCGEFLTSQRLSDALLRELVPGPTEKVVEQVVNRRSALELPTFDAAELLRPRGFPRWSSVAVRCTEPLPTFETNLRSIR